MLAADKAAKAVAKANADKAKREAAKAVKSAITTAAADAEKADFLQWCLVNRAKLQQVRDGIADVKVKPKSAAVAAANKAHDARVTPANAVGSK